MRFSLHFALAGAAAFFAGCQSLPGQKAATLESQNRVLSEQNHAQLAEMENLKAHARKLEDQVIEAEQSLARLDAQLGGDRRRLANDRTPSNVVGRQLPGLARGSLVSTGVHNRLDDFARRYRSLHYDPATGVSKLDTDILFDEGKSELKPEAQKMLREFAGIFQGPEAQELKIMVVGHTDDQQVAKKPVREQFPSNWHLSTARSVTVADFLRRAGVPDDRMGVSAFAHHQPVSPNTTPLERQRNRRVEIFITGADTPIVGWAETMPTLY